jgi:cell division septation protein DedD
VVAVGGTTLALNSDGSVSSETAWSGSGGGLSAYEPQPNYQASYGLTYTNRAVPDVSYNAGAGVAVYCNSQWVTVDGTSAGAPQWAAIEALGLSATNANLYGRAKIAYPSYFRDITSGPSNGLYSVTPGYDLVTGLGSPLTDNFGSLTVSPTSGPAGGLVTLNGVGFTANSFVNISYLNNTTWVPIANNVPTTSLQNFTYNFTAPDIQKNSPTGDNQLLSDKIVFHAIDNSNGNSYNTTIPYTEWRRGLAQIGNTTATGLYGNNTDLSTKVFVQNGQSIAVAGEWFNPGIASLLWDTTTNLGTAPIDQTGVLNATVIVPTTTAGQHMLTIYDGASNFCVNLTRLPLVTNDYDGLWHTSDLTINLTADYSVTETYYRINNGPAQTVSAKGEPVITSEGSNNILEYWSKWNVYGTGTMELPHVTLTGIELDITPPQGSMQINNGDTSTSSTTVTLSVSATDSVSGVSQMRFSNYGTWDQSTWEPYAGTVNWQLTGGDGVKTVYCQIQDNAGLLTNLNSSIILSSQQPMSISSSLTTTNPSPAPSSSPSATSTSSPSTSNSPSPEPSEVPQVPELSISMVVSLLALSTFAFAVNYKRKAHIKK